MDNQASKLPLIKKFQKSDQFLANFAGSLKKNDFRAIDFKAILIL